MGKGTDRPKIRGIAKWELYDKDGNLKEEGTAENEIKNLGLAECAKLSGDSLGGTAFLALALGSDNTANDPAQTTLVAEIVTNGGERSAATVSSQTTAVADDTARYVHQWTFTGALTIQEVAILNNSGAAGVMLGRLIIGPVTVADGDTLNFQYDTVFG